jgi:hypothetical protein
MNVRTLLVGFGLCLLALPAAAQTTTQLEHFQCYAVLAATPPVDVKVRLQDQFNSATVPGDDVEVVRANRFCNPVTKVHRNQTFPIRDDRQHLTIYATFPQTAPVRLVALSNQFNPVGAAQQVWWLHEPVALAVPTQKLPHDRPQGLDHYRCYLAKGTATFTAELVRLIDQFIPAAGHVVLNPSMFCNPVKKTRLDTGEVTPIVNPDQHLACYVMTRVPFQTSRDVINQFGPQTLAIGAPDTLCVPTRKLGFATIPDTPFGSVGSGPLEDPIQ